MSRALAAQRRDEASGGPVFRLTPRSAPAVTHDDFRFRHGAERRAWLSEIGRDPIHVGYRGEAKDSPGHAVVELKAGVEEVVALADLYTSHFEALTASIAYCRDYITFFGTLEQRHLVCARAEQRNRILPDAGLAR